MMDAGGQGGDVFAASGHRLGAQRGPGVTRTDMPAQICAADNISRAGRPCPGAVALVVQRAASDKHHVPRLAGRPDTECN